MTAVVASSAALVPVEVDGDLNIRYLDIGRDEFAAPRFDDIVEAQPGKGPAVELWIPSREVLQEAGNLVGAGPAGVILHAGRSGSTLLCNILASVEGWVAIKEPEFLNTLLLRWAGEDDPTARDRLEVLASVLLHGLSQGVRFDSHGRPRRCAVKLTSWNALLGGTLLGRFGQTPLVALVRDPWASVESLLHDPPWWYDSSPAPRSSAGLPAAAVEFFATTWTRTVETLLDLPAGRTLLLGYEEVVADPAATLRRVRHHFGDQRYGLSAESLLGVAERYSKGARSEAFDPKGRHRRRGLDDQARRVVTTIATPAWSEFQTRARTASF